MTDTSTKFRAEWKGGDGIPAAVFVGTQAEINAWAANLQINPANIFYNGSDTAGVPPGVSAEADTTTETGDNNATLYGPNGESKVVKVGSQEASNLQSEGWGLTVGSYVDPEATSTPVTVDELTGGTGNVADVDVAEAPDFLVNIDGWSSFSQQEQQLMIFEYNAQLAQQDENAQEYVDALADAALTVEPFYAQLIALTQDNILSGFNNIQNAYTQRIALIETNIARINEDLETGLDRLDLDQQSALTKLKSGYENSLVNLQNEISDSGLAFSSRAGTCYLEQLKKKEMFKHLQIVHMNEVWKI